MKSLSVVLLAAGSLFSSVTTFAQTADEIVNKHIEALGGKAKLSGIKTVYTEYDIDIMSNQGAGVSYLAANKGFRNEIEFAGQKIIECVTPSSGWTINPFQGSTSAQAMPDDQVKARQEQLNPGGPLLDYASKGSTVELAGKESVNGVENFKLKVKTKEGNESTMWIDPKTYYITKSTSKTKVNGEDIETSAAFSNYKKTDYGFVMPGTTEVSVSGMTFSISSKKVEINKDIDPKLFDKQ